MNAKDKANDLVNQYRMILMDEDTDCGNEILCTLIAIKCALVACDEILSELASMFRIDEIAYWDEVKREIKRI